MRYSLAMDTFLRDNPGVLKDLTECDNGKGDADADCADDADDDGDDHCEAGLSADKVIGVVLFRSVFQSLHYGP